jgi:hypothetical protein
LVFNCKESAYLHSGRRCIPFCIATSVKEVDRCTRVLTIGNQPTNPKVGTVQYSTHVIFAELRELTFLCQTEPHEMSLRLCCRRYKTRCNAILKYERSHWYFVDAVKIIGEYYSIVDFRSAGAQRNPRTSTSCCWDDYSASANNVIQSERENADDKKVHDTAMEKHGFKGWLAEGK